MRLLGRSLGICCAVAAIGSAAASARAEQPEFPYAAYVSIDNAYVRSGPGKHYYPTDKLVRGDAVEVYRQDPGGWLAIRPPRKSFSWVPASQLQPTKNQLATVLGDRVASHVGSRLNESRDVVQVRLERGEEVEIVAAESLTTDGQQELWCKVSPPSGEFRWIYGKFVDRTQPAPAPIARESVAVPSGTATAPTPASEPDVFAGGADAFDSNLTAVDLALSAAVVQEMSTWKFDDLERRVERLLERAQTLDQRNNARLLLDRIAKFEDIKRRSDAIAGIDTGPDRRRLQLTGMTTGPSDGHLPSGVALAGTTSRYDAVGKLTTVKSQRPNAPPYALLNADHEPIAFITPMPGVDLRPLLGRQVGVTGPRGYMPEFHKPHITAMQAEPVDGSDVIMALRDQMRR
jgi:hypothetical protein